MSELAGGKGPESQRNITSLAADTLFDARDDELCGLLKQGTVIDFRDWEDNGVFEAAVASLIDILSSPSPSPSP